jgi:hypothetical protein
MMDLPAFILMGAAFALGIWAGYGLGFDGGHSAGYREGTAAKRDARGRFLR